MSKHALIQAIEKGQLKNDGRGRFRVGDTVSVHTRIIEGEKERTQVFTGTVIARKGTGLSETFSIHRVAYGEGMERVFLLHSPRIAKIEVVQEGDVRRAKLYHLRGKQGKKARVRKRVGPARQFSESTMEDFYPQDEAINEETALAEEGTKAEANLDETRVDDATQAEARVTSTEEEKTAAPAE